MCIRDRIFSQRFQYVNSTIGSKYQVASDSIGAFKAVYYTHLRAHDHLRISYAVFCLKKKNMPILKFHAAAISPETIAHSITDKLTPYPQHNTDNSDHTTWHKVRQ